MSEGETLFAVLCLLYLSDCLVWVRRRSVLFSAPWRLKWRASFGSRYLGNLNGGLGFLNPLPPFGMAFLSHRHPVSLSPAGVSTVNLETLGDVDRPFQTGRALTYDEIFEVGFDGKSLLVNGSCFARCATAHQAETLAKRICQVSRESPENREKVIREFIDERFDRQQALERFDQARRAMGRTQAIALGFFVFLYLVVPVMVAAFGLIRLIIPAAVMMLSGAVLLCVLFARAHRTLHPLRRSDRITHIVKMISCPPASIRAGDFLMLEAMDGFHPVLLASLFLTANRDAFLRAILSDLKHPIRHGADDVDAVSIADWYAGAHLKACERLLETDGGVTLDELLTPPAWDGVSQTYCPRCSCQFTIASGECPDCPGVQLLAVPRVAAVENEHE